MSLDAGPRTPGRMQHAVAFHQSPQDLRGQLLPMVREALDRGDRLLLALAPQTAAMLREDLGTLDGITLLEHPGGPLGACGQSLAVRRARELEALTASGPVTVIGEQMTTFDGPDGRFWAELDAATQVAMEHLPLRMTCFYPAWPLHGVVLDGARWIHPLVWHDGRLDQNPEFRCPHEILTEIRAPAPVLLGAPHHDLEFDTDRLCAVRTLVERVLRERLFPTEQIDDVVLAANEVATNAVEHGRGPARLTVWAEPGSCVVEVHDRGELDDPLRGLTAPEPDQHRGWGLWVARQACEYLRLWSDRAGTHVRIHVTV